jgi:tRNA (guanine37-N1)-methyltransferase
VRIDVVTIFPDYLAPLDLSLVGKAREAGLLDLRVHDLRGWTSDRHRTVDDAPLGGGAGMVMRPDVWGLALDSLLPDGDTRGEGGAGPVEIIVPTPSGEPLTQRTAERLAGVEHLVIACGRYEGIDSRVVEHFRTRAAVTEISLGDYVLGGGEAAALVLVEVVTRLLPGVLGNPDSLVEESHGVAGLLEYPVFTRPPLWRELPVPEVLLSGHHAYIARWRRDQALERTARRRPDLLLRIDPADLDARDREVLARAGWLVTDHAVIAPVDDDRSGEVVVHPEPVAD